MYNKIELKNENEKKTKMKNKTSKMKNENIKLRNEEWNMKMKNV